MSLTIYGRVVDRDQPLFVIAELGLNHGGDVRRAVRLVDAAADAGAAAVKVQSFRADRLVSPECPAPPHVAADSLREFFRRFELDMDAHRRIANRAHERGLAMMATPFDEEVVELLEAVGCDAYKIASGDLTYGALIERAAATRKPLVISTGMGDLGEIRTALDHARAAGAQSVGLLHCVSAYPVPTGEENLNAIAELRQAFGVAVGLSDHSTEPLSVPLSVALGAVLYERHLALEDDPNQIEWAVSSTPSQLKASIEMGGRARQALGDGRVVCRAPEMASRKASRRGLHAAKDLNAGELIDPTMLLPLRPATGMDPDRIGEITGRRLVRDLSRGQPVHGGDLSGSSERGALGEAA